MASISFLVLLLTTLPFLSSPYGTNPSESSKFPWQISNDSAPCGSLEPSGILKSPGYPDGYPANKICVWTVTVDTGSQVELSFEAFELEGHDDCVYDSVEVRDGIDLDSPLLARLCGNETTKAVRSSSNRMLVKFVTDLSVNKMGFWATVDTVPCGGYLEQGEGSLQSPNYPAKYPDNIECVWRIVVDPGSHVALTFQAFEVEKHKNCSHDFVEIRDGRDFKSPLIVRYCGTEIPYKVWSTSNQMLVRFVTDSKTAETGFSATFVTAGCGGNLEQTEGSLQSPNYPDKYPSNVDCVWRITVTPGSLVALKFRAFEVEQHDNCSYDFVEVRDGVDIRSPRLAFFCQNSTVNGEIPDEIWSSSNSMFVRFVSDKSFSGKGFSATFVTARCGGVLEQPEGNLQSPNYPDGYGANLECEWRITVDPGKQVVLSFQAFEVEYDEDCPYDFVEILDGGELGSPLLARLCGDKIPNEIWSSSNSMLVRFVSDKLLNLQGFFATFVTDSCGGLVKGKTGSISSPSFPELYPANKKCTWDIVAPPNFLIILTFTHFELQGTNTHQECKHDRLDLQSKSSNETEWKNHGTYCGSRLPPELKSTGNVLRMEFVADKSEQKRGFSAHYITDQDECALNNGGCEHICKNTFGSYRCSCRHGFVLLSNGHECKEESCFHQVLSSAGVVSSPNFPDNDTSVKECTWIFYTKPGNRIKVVFDWFEQELQHECASNNVTLYDWDSAESPLLGRFCGSKKIQPVISTAQTMFMAIQFDPAVQGNGFKATHKTVCGGRLRAGPTRTILYSHSTFGDQNYDGGIDCSWIITSPNAGKVELSFHFFDLQSKKDCACDSVQVLDGFATSPSLGKFCGHKIPPNMTSSGSRLLIRFHSDASIEGKGFALDYSEVLL